MSMQVVARARAAGLTCRPRDIFVEQTVARLALVAKAPTATLSPTRASGAVQPTPIIRWLAEVERTGGAEFNQTVVVQAPAGVDEADVAVVLQALLDRHAMLRLRVEEGWSLQVPEAGAARPHLQTVDELSEDAVGGGAVAVEPGGRCDAQCPLGGRPWLSWC